MGRRSALLIGAFLLFGMAFAREISLDYDRTVDFSSYKTYLWMQGTPAANQNVDRAIVQGVDAQLQGKGFTKVEKEAELYVLYSVALRQEVTSTDLDYGKFKFNDRNVVVRKVTAGTLVVEVADARTKSLLWRATATEAVSADPTQTQEAIPPILALMFKNFPPKGAR